MIQTLPNLILRTKELLLLNAPCASSDLDSPFAEFKVRQLNNAQVNLCLTQMLTITRTEDAPFAVVADYNLLAFNDFAYIRAVRRNRIMRHIPIIAVADKDVKIDVKTALRAGIDDCYRAPVNCSAVRERLKFLHRHKAELARVDPLASDNLNVRISPFKRAIDVVGASCVLALASPVLLATAVLIRLESPGPVIYRSKRSGTGYNVFDFWKFRSMYSDADKRLNEIQHLNQYSDTTFVKVKNDPRVTRVGRFIRKFSIDELPQLFNVLRGEMSLVGNRPLPLYEAEQLTKEDATYRFLAPAGLTGLWQVTKRGGNEMSADERIGLDVTYAQNHSFWYDLRILLKTPFAIIQKENV